MNNETVCRTNTSQEATIWHAVSEHPFVVSQHVNNLKACHLKVCQISVTDKYFVALSFHVLGTVLYQITGNAARLASFLFLQTMRLGKFEGIKNNAHLPAQTKCKA